MNRAKLYRWYCGLTDKNGELVYREDYTRVMDKLFPGYTAFMAVGRWNGEPENTMVFEVIDLVDKRGVCPEEIANILRRAGNQESVLVTCHEIEAALVF